MLARWWLVVVAGACVVACGLGCSRGEDVREWRADDHDHAPGTSGATPAGTKATTAAERGALLVDAAWATQCASCHGPDGRGDGPSGPMVKAPDLTRAALLDQAKDADLAAVIQQGRGKMPKFDLPPEVVSGLIKRIRLRKAR